MSYVLWSLVIALFPLLAWAEYNPEAIKQGITEHKNSFLVESWRKTENGEGWIAKTTAKGVVLSVGRNNAGIITALQTSDQALAAMARCLMLGAIGMSPSTEAQRGKIGTVIQDAAKSQSMKALVMNGVKFEVTPQEVGGNVFLSCILSPSQQRK